jgi:hypothetical protein
MGVTYDSELEDGITAMVWGIPIHIWETFPRRARAKMTAIRHGKSTLDWAALKGR